jgi:hypothetical protein
MPGSTRTPVKRPKDQAGGAATTTTTTKEEQAAKIDKRARELLARWKTKHLLQKANKTLPSTNFNIRQSLQGLPGAVYNKITSVEHAVIGLPGSILSSVKQVQAEGQRLARENVDEITEKDVITKLDEDGLRKAYVAVDGTYYDSETQTLYSRGTYSKFTSGWSEGLKSADSWLQNVNLLTNSTKAMDIYKNLAKAYEDLVKDNHPVCRLVGHSAGGSAALQLQKDLRAVGVEVDCTTFAAPEVASVSDQYGLNGHYPDRFSGLGDVVSGLDNVARRNKEFSLNPLKQHDYRGFAGLLEHWTYRR